jgi:histidine triad (HIT) family protein
MASIFSRIAAGEFPCHKVAEEECFLAFLDINPLAEGHTLVIPKKETDYIFDLEEEEYRNLFAFAKKVGMAIGEVIPCKRVGLTVVGLEVPHAHIHLIPINGIADMEFSRPKLNFTPEQLEHTALLIHMAFNNITPA